MNSLEERLAHYQMGFFDALMKAPKKDISNVFLKSAYDNGWSNGGGTLELAKEGEKNE